MDVKESGEGEVLISNGNTVLGPYDSISLFEGFVEVRDGETVVKYECSDGSVGDEIGRFPVAQEFGERFP